MTTKEMLKSVGQVTMGFVSDYVVDLTNTKLPTAFPITSIHNGVVIEINDVTSTMVLETLDWLRQAYEASEDFDIIDFLYTIKENEKMGNISCTIIGQAVKFLIETAEVLKESTKLIMEKENK